jgi:hypothetical protein
MYKHEGNYETVGSYGWTGDPGFGGFVCLDLSSSHTADYFPIPVNANMSTAWMDTTDTCSGFRVLNNPNVALALSNNATFNPSQYYACPAGWRWASTMEGMKVFYSQATQAQMGLAVRSLARLDVC